MNRRATTIPLLLCALLFTFITCVHADPTPATAPHALRIACVGASITAGFGTANHVTDSFPAQLQHLLGPAYDIHNFGASGRTMLKKGDRPFWITKNYTDALALNPDIVLIDLGGNDSKAINWTHKADFPDDSRAMIRSFQSLPAHPRILLLLPMPCFRPLSTGINDDIITKEQIPILRAIATELHVEPIDMHTPFTNKGAWFADGIHPNAEGAKLAATLLQQAILAPATQPATIP